MIKRIIDFFRKPVVKGLLYPEIEIAGGLNYALNIEFANINSTLRIPVDRESGGSPSMYATVKNGSRFSQIHTGAEKKIYLPDFWKEGVCLAQGRTDDVAELAKVLDSWLCANVTTDELAKTFSFVKPYDKAAAFDDNKEVEYTWHRIQNDASREELKAFVDLAMVDKVLGSLFPYTSLNRLCFSRCTGYPYTYDTLIVIPLDNDEFEIRGIGNQLLGRGKAIEALRIVKDNLPIGIKPAVKGTSKDLQSLKNEEAECSDINF